jgi:hypothetical protein
MWRELIKRVWEVDPLLLPRCGTELVKLSAVRDPVVIAKILRHVHLWEEPPLSFGPPCTDFASPALAEGW